MPEAKGSVWLGSKPPPVALKVMNAVMRPVLRSRLARRMNGVMLLEFRGRRTGREYRVPANFHLVDDVPMAFTDAPWRLNFAEGADVTVRYRGVANASAISSSPVATSATARAGSSSRTA